MKLTHKIIILCIITFLVFNLEGCFEKIERSGIIVDKLTKEPIQGVSIDIYLKYQRKDSLKEKVLTDKRGHFFINELRDRRLLFQLNKDGYISQVSPLSVEKDTIEMERVTERLP